MLINEIKFNEKLTPAMKQYVSLKEKHTNSLLFFRMGDFYELFFDDAIVTSKELNITLTKRGKVQDKDIPMCGIPYHALDNYLPRLIKSGFRIAICEQTETPEEMKINIKARREMHFPVALLEKAYTIQVELGEASVKN